MQANVDWFDKRVSLTPDHTAVIDSETKKFWTYQQLNERATFLANYFLREGLEKGDRVAILAPNHISYFDFFFGCMKIGAVFVPLNWRLSEPELNYVLHDCKPKILGYAKEFQQEAVSLKTEASMIEIDGNNYFKKIAYDIPLIDSQIKEEDPLAMIYTGGTTGKPKGVVLSHRSILWNALNTITSWSLESGDTTLTSLPMFHTGGLNVFTLPLLLIGGKVVIASKFIPEKAVKYLIEYKCTVVLFVPTMYHMLIQTEIFRKSSFPDMKMFISGGAPCPHKIYKAFAEKGIPFKEGYGLTEAGPNNFYINHEDSLEKLGSVGKPMLFNDIKIIADDGNQAGVNEVGELLLRGNHSFEYYWNNEEQTNNTLIDGWIHTGDLAKQDEEGYVYIVGRKKDMIITGGENVYPLEIEHWLEAHEDIEEAAVIGLPDEKWGEVVTAFVVLKRDMPEKQLIDYCKRKLSSYKTPKKFFLLEELPKTHVGKIDKAGLKAYTKDFGLMK